MTTSIPPKMMGAVPTLKNKGLVEVFKKSTSEWSSRKRKFVKIKNATGQPDE